MRPSGTSKGGISSRAGGAPRTATPPTDADVAPWGNLGGLAVEEDRRLLAGKILGKPRFGAHFTRELFIQVCLLLRDARFEIEMETKFPGSDPRPVAQDVAGELHRIEQAAINLHLAMNAACAESVALMAHGGSAVFGKKQTRRARDRGLAAMMEDVAELARDALRAAEVAKSISNTRHPIAPFTVLVIGLERVLAANGFQVDGRKTGALFQWCAAIVSIAEYAEIFGCPKDLRRSIGSALALDDSTKGRVACATMPLKRAAMFHISIADKR